MKRICEHYRITLKEFLRAGSTNSLFLFIFAIFINLAACRPYSGDGEFIDNGWISFSERCQIYFADFPVSKGLNYKEYKFTGFPCGTLVIYFNLFSECNVEEKKSFSFSEEEKLEKILNDSDISIEITVVDGERRIYQEKNSLDMSSGKWLFQSMGPVRFVRRDMAYDRINVSRNSTYTFEILVEAGNEPPEEICLRPFVLGGSSFAL